MTLTEMGVLVYTRLLSFAKLVYVRKTSFKVVRTFDE